MCEDVGKLTLTGPLSRIRDKQKKTKKKKKNEKKK